MVNVVLNLIFVIVFDWGVAGVATATIVAETISAILVLLCLHAHEGPIRLQDVYKRQDRPKIMKLWILQKNDQYDTGKGNQRCNLTDIQCHQLPGDGRTDIGTHDDPNSLLQAH